MLSNGTDNRKNDINVTASLKDSSMRTNESHLLIDNSRYVAKNESKAIPMIPECNESDDNYQYIPKDM